MVMNLTLILKKNEKKSSLRKDEKKWPLKKDEKKYPLKTEKENKLEFKSGLYGQSSHKEINLVVIILMTCLTFACQTMLILAIIGKIGEKENGNFAFQENSIAYVFHLYHLHIMPARWTHVFGMFALLGLITFIVIGNY